MKNIAGMLALTIAGALASTPSLAKISHHERGAYPVSGTRSHARDQRYIEGKDVQINRPRPLTGPASVYEAPFRSES